MLILRVYINVKFALSAYVGFVSEFSLVKAAFLFGMTLLLFSRSNTTAMRNSIISCKNLHRFETVYLSMWYLVTKLFVFGFLVTDRRNSFFILQKKKSSNLCKNEGRRSESMPDSGVVPKI